LVSIDCQVFLEELRELAVHGLQVELVDTDEELHRHVVWFAVDPHPVEASLARHLLEPGSELGLIHAKALRNRCDRFGNPVEPHDQLGLLGREVPLEDLDLDPAFCRGKAAGHVVEELT
jgi:hypothetical protein